MAKQFHGHCQICGRQHKADSRSVAKHGYTIERGWQSGACYGSGGKPIEVSCDLIEGAIEAADRYVTQALAEIVDLATRPDTEELHVFTTRETRSGSKTQLHRVKLHQMEKNVALVSGGSTLQTLRHTTVAAQWARLVARRIAYLQETIAEARENKVWLQERADNWKPSELQPVTEAEVAAAGPKAHLALKRYGYDATACCSSAMAAQKSYSKMKARTEAEVTCAACLKFMATR